MRTMIENCTSLAISKLQKAIRKIVDRDYPNSTDEELYVHTEEELKKFTANGQTFNYTAIKNPMGGHRWFFLCPQCEERVGKLFLPPEGCGLESKYLCKKCHNIKNQSAVMAQDKVYKAVTRPLKRMKEIENKISRGYLHPDKVQELLNEYEDIEKQVKSTPEYRVYTFKRTHGMI